VAEQTPQQTAAARQQAALDYAAQFDVSDEPPPPILDEEEPPARQLPPRAPDGTFKKVHPAALKNLAVDLGIPDEAIEGLETAGLDRLVKITARQALRLQREANANQRTLANSIDHNLGNQPAPPQPQPEEDWLAGAQLEAFDPTIQKALQKISDQEKTIKELREQVVGVNQRETQRVARTSGEMLDQAFEGLGAAFEPFFGKGNAVDGEVEAESMTRRRALVQMAGIDFSKSFSARSVATAIKKAAESMYRPALKAATPRDTYAEPETPPPTNRPQPTVTARPTQRTTAPEPPGRQKAIRSVSRMMEAQLASENNETNGAAEPEDFLE
jgi:hypothetical protein